jgi:hypothetical protein
VHAAKGGQVRKPKSSGGSALPASLPDNVLLFPLGVPPSSSDTHAAVLCAEAAASVPPPMALPPPSSPPPDAAEQEALLVKDLCRELRPPDAAPVTSDGGADPGGAAAGAAVPRFLWDRALSDEENVAALRGHVASYRPSRSRRGKKPEGIAWFPLLSDMWALSMIESAQFRRVARYRHVRLPSGGGDGSAAAGSDEPASSLPPASNGASELEQAGLDDGAGGSPAAGAQEQRGARDAEEEGDEGEDGEMLLNDGLRALPPLPPPNSQLESPETQHSQHDLGGSSMTFSQHGRPSSGLGDLGGGSLDPEQQHAYDAERDLLPPGS